MGNAVSLPLSLSVVMSLAVVATTLLLIAFRAKRSRLTCDRFNPSDNLQKIRNDLPFIMDVDNGLLDELRTNGVLNGEQIEAVKTKPLLGHRVSELMTIVDGLSADGKDKFIDALNNTRQGHVVNYIRRGGNLDATDRGEWPLYMWKQQWSLFEMNWRLLVEITDPVNGLVDEMLSARCITPRQKQTIDAEKTDSDRNERIFLMLQRRSVADFRRFIDCLGRTKQTQVVHVLRTQKPADDDDDYCNRPLSEERKLRMLVNYATLIGLLDSTCGLLTELYAARVITQRQKEFIEAASTPSQSNTRLLDILRRGSEADFDAFIDCLDSTGQRHVSRVLLGDGIVAQLDAELCGQRTDAVDRTETRIVDRFMRLLDGCSEDRRRRLFARVSTRMNELNSRGVELIALKTKHSIGLFYRFTTLSGLRYLDELYSAQQLGAAVEALFTALLADDDVDRQPIRVDQLTWSVTDYVRCVKYFCHSTDLPLFADMYTMAEQTRRNADCSVCAVCIERLPFELVEMIIVRAAGQLFVAVNRQTPRAEVYTMLTLAAVSVLWQRTMTYRRWNKRLLRRHFARVCRPYRTHSRPSPTLTVKRVEAVALLTGRLYVICTESSVVQVFAGGGGGKSTFDRLEDVKIHGLKHPTDIAACGESSRRLVYVADCDSQCVWRVDLLPSPGCSSDTRHIPAARKPYTLSLTDGRLLVTSRDGNALFLYGDSDAIDDDAAVQQIQLPSYMYAHHAVETRRQTYVVCHAARLTAVQHPSNVGVSELSGSGAVLCVYANPHDGGPRQLGRAVYMALDVDGRVLVADQDEDRVLLLGADLRFQRVLIAPLGGHPLRLCYNQRTGSLVVRYFRSSRITVHSVRVT